MKLRWLLALVGLVIVTPDLVRADYLLMILNLGQARLTPPPKPSGGQMGMGGAATFVPTQPPLPTGPLAGNMGALGYGGYSLIGGPAVEGQGVGGGKAGMAGAQGGMMGAQGMRGSPTTSVQLVPVCVELDHTPNIGQVKLLDAGSKVTLPVKHKWGTAHLIATSGPLVLGGIYRNYKDGKMFPRLARRFDAEEKKILRSGTSAADKLAVAETALTMGQFKKFEDTMEQLVKDDKNSPVVTAYLKVKEELAKKVDKLPAVPWYARLLRQGYDDKLRSPHFVLLHKTFQNDDLTRVKVRINHLEDHLRDYYYWWALRGKVLPTPKEKLVCLVTYTADEFKHFHRVFSGSPIVFDGFHSIETNILVTSLYPLSDKYHELEGFSNQYWQMPMVGTRPHVLKGTTAAPTSTEQVEAYTVALALRALEETSEQASISHDGTRQLLYACGLLPPHVTVPEWVLFGMSSIFENTPSVPWKTAGAPNPLYLGDYFEMLKHKELEPLSPQILREVVTDGFFRKAHEESKNGLNRKKTHDQGKDGLALKKAQTTAWSLCFYLARKERVKLEAYFRELARMPRDLELDEEVLFGCFARAFDAWDNNRSAVDPARLTWLVSQWNNDMIATRGSILETVQMLHNLDTFVKDVEHELVAHPADGTGGPGPGGPGARKGP